MADAYRISPSLFLACCLALAAFAAQGQAQPSATPQPSTTPQPPAPQPSAAPATTPAVPATTDTPQAPTLGGPGVTNNPQPATQTPMTTPAAAAPAPPAKPAAPPPPPVNPDQLQFQLKLPPQKGKPGGSATGSAASLDYKREDYAVLAGSVHIHYQDIDLQADQAEIDLTSREVIALGNVIVDQGPRRMTGVSATFNLETKTGTLKQATARVAPDYYFSGTEIVKTGDNTYEVTNGIFTSCDQKVPDWSFRLGRARVEMEGYAHMRHVSMRVKSLPVLYLPYVLWPAKTERSSGFLVPNIGYSDRRGAQLGLAYFQTLGRSYDTTIHTDLFSKNFLGLGDEFRYRPSAGTTGDLIGYMVHDTEKLPDEPRNKQRRWKVEWNHDTTDLPWGMRGLVHYLNYSDFNFFRDFERDFDRNTVRFLDSRASATGNWGPNLVNFLLDNRETFVGVGNDTLIQRKLPDVEYRLRSTQVGKSPFYVELDSSAAYLDVSQPGGYAGKYGRFDLFPQVTLPIRSFPWLSLSVTGGERLTWYGDSLRTTTTDTGTTTAFQGQAVTRALPYGSAEIVGPSISRIFDLDLGRFGKFKHVIEPRFTYTYQGTYDKQQEIPQFDEIDTQFASNVGRVALDSRVLGKPKDEKQSAREVLLLEIARSYSFDKTQPLLGVASVGTAGGVVTPGTTGTLSSQAGPLEGLLRFNPSDRSNLKLEATYDTLYKRLATTGLTGNYGLPSATYAGVTWFTRYETDTGETLGNQIRLNGAFPVIPRKLRFEGQVNYDLQLRLLQQQRYVLTWTSQCYGLVLELRDFRSQTGVPGATQSDKEIRFSLSLKNVGTFLDLTSRSSSIVQ
jgi:LPS-assembly protein